MKRYLLNVTFYAGSDAEEDTDRDLFILCVDKEFSAREITATFWKVNELLDDYDEDELDAKGANFPISYGMGLGIDTLMRGIEIYTKGKVTEMYDECGKIESFDNYYVIEQWQ